MQKARGKRQDARGKEAKASDKRQEARGKRQEARGKRQGGPQGWLRAWGTVGPKSAPIGARAFFSEAPPSGGGPGTNKNILLGPLGPEIC